MEEWLDSEALRLLREPQQRHDRKMLAVDIRRRMNQLTKTAERLTLEAIDRASRPKPTMREARAREVEEQSAVHRSEAADTSPVLRPTDDVMESHNDMLADLLTAYNQRDRNGD